MDGSAAFFGQLVRARQLVEHKADLRDDSQTGPDELTVGSLRLVVHVSGPVRSLMLPPSRGV